MKNKQIPVRKSLPQSSTDGMVVVIEGYKFKGREIHSLAELVKRFLEDDTTYAINISIASGAEAKNDA